ncbi:PIN domain-containing protein [Streptomyces decoyicus]
MIILDTNILWGLTPEDSSADFLRAIKAVGGERVAVPWMVLEELAAQKAIKYEERHEKAAEAVEALREYTPWGLEVPIGPSEPEEVRRYWRQRWSTVVEEIPTSSEAMREALFREANQLRPCRLVKGVKIGSRDAAIWLSAVEYARKNPSETVYFVSANTKDFGDGTAFPAPMDKDVAGLEDRLRLLPTMAGVVAQFATEKTTDDAAVRALLADKRILSQLLNAATDGGWLPMDGSFDCTVGIGPGRDPVVVAADGWVTAGQTMVAAVEAMQSYSIGEQEWCLAVVRCQLIGMIVCGGATEWASCEFTASVLLSLGGDDQLTLLRTERPRPVSADVYRSLPLPSAPMTEREEAMMQSIREAVGARMYTPRSQWSRLPRAYEGAALRTRMRPDVSLKVDHEAPPGG